MQDYLKIFLVSLVTSVAVLFALGPVMLRLQAPQGPRQQSEAAATPTGAERPPPAAETLAAPNLVGLELSAARERWRAQGIAVIEDSQRVDPSVGAGTILSQAPLGGAPLQNKEIRVVVAAAPELVSVPSVVGRDVAAATEALVEAGFEVPAPTLRADDAPAGQVLEQDPNPGSESNKGALVRLVVSGDGGAPGEATIEVPKLLRLPLSRARRELEAAGLRVGTVREREDMELSGRRVLEQSPAAGTKVAPDSVVDLVVVAPD